MSSFAPISSTARRGPLGQHTPWTPPYHPRPRGDAAGVRLRDEGRSLRESDVEPTLFCGGGWYMDGKAGAEDLIAKVLNDPALMKTLASAPKPEQKSTPDVA